MLECCSQCKESGFGPKPWVSLLEPLGRITLLQSWANTGLPVVESDVLVQTKSDIHPALKPVRMAAALKFLYVKS